MDLKTNCDDSNNIIDNGEDDSGSINSNNKRIIVSTSHDELSRLDKEQLIDKVISMQQHIKQLKTLIDKHKLVDSKPTSNKSSNRKASREFNFACFKLRHIFLKFLYLGWNYDGYVVQEGFSNTVEDRLFEALMKTKLIENRESCNYHRCGRTDKGVSAYCQVVSLTVRSQMKNGSGLIRPDDFVGKDEEIDQDQNPEDIESQEIDYLSALNGVLPKDIRVIAWAPVSSPSVSARFDCEKRVYHYHFPRCQLDIGRMNQACGYLVGKHDFRNLCKMDVQNGVTNYVRRVYSASVESLDKHSNNNQYDPDSICLFQIEASAFLWHQIRCIMGVLFLVGQMLEQPSVMEQLLDIETNPSKPQYLMASDLPLVLYHSDYSADLVPKWFYGKCKTSVSNVLAELRVEWAKRSIQAAVIKSMSDSLHETYDKHFNDDIDPHQINSQLNNLLTGIKPKVYKPLFERPLCDSLETRLKKCQSRKKIKLQ